MTAKPTLAELAGPLLEAMPAREIVALDLGDCRIEIATNHPPLAERLRHYFRHVTVDRGAAADIRVVALECPAPDFGLAFTDWPRDPGKVGRKDAFADVGGGRVCHKVRTGMQFLFGGGLRLAVGPCLENDNQVINFVNAQYSSWLLDRGWSLCHAAGVVSRGRGLAVAGLSGGGKSTLSLHLMSHGFSFTSNDRLLIRRDGDGTRMAGIPKLPRINPGTALHNPDLEPVLPGQRRRELETLDEDDLWELEEKYDVDITALFGADRFATVGPLDVFVVLAWSRESDQPTRLQRVEPAARPDLLRAVMKSPGPFYLPAGDAPPPAPLAVDPRAYLANLTGVAVYEATGKVDFGAAVEACQEILWAVAER